MIPMVGRATGDKGDEGVRRVDDDITVGKRTIIVVKMYIIET